MRQQCADDRRASSKRMRAAPIERNYRAQLAVAVRKLWGRGREAERGEDDAPAALSVAAPRPLHPSPPSARRDVRLPTLFPYAGCPTLQRASGSVAQQASGSADCGSWCGGRLPLRLISQLINVVLLPATRVHGRPPARRQRRCGRRWRLTRALAHWRLAAGSAQWGWAIP